MNMENHNEVVKKTRGRPKGSFKENKLTDDKDYYNKRHHATNIFIRCEACGCVFRKRSMRKHLNTKIHIEGIKLRNIEEIKLEYLEGIKIENLEEIKINI